MPETESPFTPPDAAEARARREFTALLRITERHAVEDERRQWERHRAPLPPLGALERVVCLAGGSLSPAEGAPPVDTADLMAALSLVESARAHVDALETGLLEMARGRGLTWQEIAFGLGLGSPQAARQRYERLAGRAAAQRPTA